MTKKDLVDRISLQVGITKVETEATLDEFFKQVGSALYAGEHIEIRGFGTFKTKEQKARKGRNPRTGESVPIPAHIKPVFKFSRQIKKMLNP